MIVHPAVVHARWDQSDIKLGSLSVGRVVVVVVAATGSGGERRGLMIKCLAFGVGSEGLVEQDTRTAWRDGRFVQGWWWCKVGRYLCCAKENIVSV